MGRQETGAPGALGALDGLLLEALMGIALEAGKEALEPRRREAKRRARPEPARLPPADRARRLVIDALAEIAPHAPVVAAGDPLFQDPPSDRSSDLFLVSALDGAASDLGPEPSSAEIGDLSISIAAIRAGVPVMGVVYAPGRGRLWAARDGEATALEAPLFAAAEPLPIRIRSVPDSGPIGVTPDSLDPLLDSLGAAETRIASVAVAICLVAEGSADFASAPAGTPAWHVAAADAVLRAAGGRVFTLQGASLLYRWSNGGGGAALLALPAAAALGGARLPEAETV